MFGLLCQKPILSIRNGIAFENCAIQIIEYKNKRRKSAPKQTGKKTTSNYRMRAKVYAFSQ